MAAVVHLHTVWDWSNERYVGPFVGHVAGLAWSWLEMAVSVTGAVRAHPYPASVGLGFGLALEAGEFCSVHACMVRLDIHTYLCYT